jgi:putative ABC transport system permease protein
MPGDCSFYSKRVSYDRHHEKADRIYRVNGEIKFGGNHYKLAVASAPFADAAVHDFPEVESAVRFRTRGSYLVKRSESTDNIKENDVIWTDSTFFNVFSVPVLSGNASTRINRTKLSCHQ